uniref:Uncharacterized protein n=2 Tax=Brassica oleracea TaxID=3712 RepID=A0A0D3DMG2_BRAOL
MQVFGFSKISVSGGQQLEFVCDDFVKGHPERLEKIGDRYVAKLRAFLEKRYKPFEDWLKNAKTKEEWDLAVKEHNEFFENDSKERRESRVRMEISPPPALENQGQSNGTVGTRFGQSGVDHFSDGFFDGDVCRKDRM